MEELARQIQSYVYAFSDPDNVSWADIGSRRAGDALVPAQRRFRGRVRWNTCGAGGDGAGAGGKVQAPGDGWC